MAEEGSKSSGGALLLVRRRSYDAADDGLERVGDLEDAAVRARARRGGSAGGTGLESRLTGASGVLTVTLGSSPRGDLNRDSIVAAWRAAAMDAGAKAFLESVSNGESILDQLLFIVPALKHSPHTACEPFIDVCAAADPVSCESSHDHLQEYYKTLDQPERLKVAEMYHPSAAVTFNGERRAPRHRSRGSRRCCRQPHHHAEPQVLP